MITRTEERSRGARIKRTRAGRRKGSRRRSACVGAIGRGGESVMPMFATYTDIKEQTKLFSLSLAQRSSSSAAIQAACGNACF